MIVFRRLLSLVVVLLALSAVVFILSRVVPGDPARATLGEEATPDMVAQFRREYGLDLPLPVQYVRYLQQAVQGDLGISLLTGQPVADDLRDRLPATIELTVASLVWAVVLGLPLGILAAVRQGNFIDSLTRTGSLALIGVPVFWSSLLLQLVFYRQLPILPYGARVSEIAEGFRGLTGLLTVDALLQGRWDVWRDALVHLILPSFSLAGLLTTVIVRTVRQAMIETLREPYVRTARAKGLAESRVIVRHALRNAMLPVLTVTGLRLGELMAGAVITETVFQWPGVGLYAVTAISRLDYQAIMGFVLVTATSFALINLAVDLLYVALDPRIRV